MSGSGWKSMNKIQKGAVIVIIIQFIIIGILSTVIILNNNHTEIEYNPSPLLIEYKLKGGFDPVSYRLRIHSDGFYSTDSGRIGENLIASYLPEGQLEEIINFLSSHNISNYNNLHFHNSTICDGVIQFLHYYDIYNGQVINCSRTQGAIGFLGELDVIFTYFHDLLFDLKG